MLLNFRETAQKNEKIIYCKKAGLSANHSRYHGPEDDHRLPYKRDVDRIIHSKAYSRYTDKTQVVYLVDNDHITHRSLHVQLVSNFARGIAEVLRLNTDLVEAIALGHDVAHPPFGHEGELYLSALSKKQGNGAFAHPYQSCRLFSEIEPLNLGLAVYDGFLCHDGGMNQHVLNPRFNKSWEEHFADRKTKLSDPNKNIIPATLEGCLVKWCDTMSFVGKDIEDAISLGIITRKDIPTTSLGDNNRDILTNLAKDIILHSCDKDYIAVSEQSCDSLKKLRTFNFRSIYTHPKLKGESDKIKRSYHFIFNFLLEDYDRNKEDSYLWKNFAFNKDESYLDKASGVQMVIDFIAGMTDKYFVKTVESLILPKNITL